MSQRPSKIEVERRQILDHRALERLAPCSGSIPSWRPRRWRIGGATWPQTVVQTCVIHLLRASFRYGSNDDRKKIAAGLRPIYNAVTIEAAAAALAEFEAGIGGKYLAIVRLWRNSWDTFTPFLAFPAEIRKVVYTTDVIVNPRFFSAASDPPSPGRHVRRVRQARVRAGGAPCRCSGRRRLVGRLDGDIRRRVPACGACER